ncbi:MAG TPA: phosphotransferase [Gaiellaceae bacterium]|nr:phosphotransferase [Gaiellaceae bacterium]
MTIVDRLTSGDLGLVEEQRLRDHVRGRRWYGSKTQEITHAHIVDAAVVRTESPLLVVAVAEVRFHEGTHDLYQLLLGLRPADEGAVGEAIGETDGWVVYDALDDAALARELLSLMRRGATVPAVEGSLEFQAIDPAALGGELGMRPAGVEQSNTSVVFGDELILKAYRRLEAGINPELELLRFLTERGFANIARLHGWYAYSGRPVEATLGILQRYVPSAVDGWELAIAEVGARPEEFLARLRRLGEVTGALHTALGSDPADVDFAPEEPSTESLALLTATVDEEIEAIFLDLPETEAVEPIAGRGEEVRDRLRLMSHVGAVGRAIRTHGDYHLGQTLWTGTDWVVIDFEGEPARGLAERRRKRSPLRDVAGMLRSFAYAASAVQILHGGEAPAGWEQRAREEFLDGYFGTVDRSLVPPSEEGKARLLAVFELEKAVYELRYELNNRPDWVGIPVAGILRLLEAPL